LADSEPGNVGLDNRSDEFDRGELAVNAVANLDVRMTPG